MDMACAQASPLLIPSYSAVFAAVNVSYCDKSDPAQRPIPANNEKEEVTLNITRRRL